jgi:hypothetical protein
MKSVYSAVWTGSLNEAVCASSLKGQSTVKAIKNKVLRRVNNPKPLVTAMEEFGIMPGWTNDQFMEHFHLLIQTQVNNQQSIKLNNPSHNAFSFTPRPQAQSINKGTK